jgi:oxygen-independent coproporphyrinogen-3 oxidase
MNHRSTTTYIRHLLRGRSPVAESEHLSPRERALELLVFALRRPEGVKRAWFRQVAGMELDPLAGDLIAELASHRLMLDTGTSVQLTREGLMLSDAVFSRILTTSSAAA